RWSECRRSPGSDARGTSANVAVARIIRLYLRPSNSGALVEGASFMKHPSSLEQLTELFRRSGARDPEGWANSEINEGINQLGRFLFLRQAWKQIVADGNEAWINSAVARAQKEPNGVGAGIGIALQRALSAGATREDLTEIVRGMQWQLLSDLCYLL